MSYYPDDADVGDRFQMEDAAFYEVFSGRYWYREPIDERAVYGYPRLGDRDPDEVDVPIRTAPRDLKAAIRTLGTRHDLKRHPDDRVRVNDRNWMTVIQPGENVSANEGFVCQYENGTALYAVEPYHGSDRPPGTFDSSWMYRYDDFSSEGGVGCIEVEWGDADER